MFITLELGRWPKDGRVEKRIKIADMKKWNKWLSLACLYTLAACQDNTCRVEGQLANIPGETTVYMLRRTGEFARDTLLQTTMQEGRFRLEVPADMWGEQYELKFGNTRSSITFFAEQGKVQINGDGKMLYKAKVTGTPGNECWNSFQKFSVRLSERRNELSRELNESGAPDSVKQARFARLFQESNEATERYKDSLAAAEPNSVAALFLYYQSLPMLKHKRIDEILAKFSPQLADNRYYKEMKARADVLRKLAPGAVAPDFEIGTPDGSKVKLSSFRGKYLILDFWASWCAPCREGTVYIKELYDRFHDAGLDVFSISLDDQKEPWLKAIHDDGMTWHHGCQLLKGGKHTPVARLYGIDGLPAIWVIAPDGKILAEGLHGEALVDFCTSLFQN